MRTGLTSSIVSKLKAFVRARRLMLASVNGQLFQAKAAAEQQRRRADYLESRLKTFVHIRVYPDADFRRRAMVVDVQMIADAFPNVSREKLYEEALTQLIEQIRIQEAKR